MLLYTVPWYSITLGICGNGQLRTKGSDMIYTVFVPHISLITQKSQYTPEGLENASSCHVPQLVQYSTSTTSTTSTTTEYLYYQYHIVHSTACTTSTGSTVDMGILSPWYCTTRYLIYCRYCSKEIFADSTTSAALEENSHR
jgi:hypothetical protein